MTGESPFVGLNPFTERDDAYFCGRDTESEIIGGNLRAAKLTLLYGPSGVGKSSLLNAGVAARLRTQSASNVASRGKPGFVVVVFRNWRGNPTEELRDAIATSVQPYLSDRLAPEAGIDTLLQKWRLSRQGDLLLILDQFEEFFINQPSIQHLSDILAPVIADRALPVNVLIALREDWLSALDHFKGKIPSLFENYFRLEPLQYANAIKAICEPIERYKKRWKVAVTIQPGLEEAVLRQSCNEPLSSSAGSDCLKQQRFEPLVLQLIMDRLWREEQPNGNASLKLDTLAQLTKDTNVVDAHVDAAMRQLTGSERRTAAVLIDRLVTPLGTRIAQSSKNLALHAAVPLPSLANLLEKLSAADARILNSVPPPRNDAGEYFEVAHDALAVALSKWQVEYARTRRTHRHLLAVSVSALIAVAFAVLAGITYQAKEVTVQQNRDLQAVKARLGSASKIVTLGNAAAFRTALLATYGASRSGASDDSIKFDFDHRYLEQHDQTNVSQMRAMLNLLCSIGALRPDQPARLMGGYGAFGVSALEITVTYSGAVAESPFLRGGSIRSASDYQAVARGAIAGLLADMPDQTMRMRVLTDQDTWQRMANAGYLKFKALFPDAPPSVLGAITNDYLQIEWWSESMSALGTALRELLSKPQGRDRSCDSGPCPPPPSLASAMDTALKRGRNDWLAAGWGVVALHAVSGSHADVKADLSGSVINCSYDFRTGQPAECKN